MIMVATDNVDDEMITVPRRYNLKSFAVSALTFGQTDFEKRKSVADLFRWVN